jgi:hypothetical protein
LAFRLTAKLAAIMVLSAGLIGLGMVPAATAASAHSGITPPHNPSRSLAPSPDFVSFRSPCHGGSDGRSCNLEVLKAIAHARKVLEKLGGMSFSLAAYQKLTRAEQLFVTANLERTARGLRPFSVLTRSLDKIAQLGANADEDPPLDDVPARLPGGGQVVGLAANWAGGWGNALASDYAWMYDDGPGSSNEDCSSADPQGCWGHRDNILATLSSSRTCGGGRSALAMGAGYAAAGQSEAELFAGVCGRTPTDVVLSWAQAKSRLHIR